MNYSTVGYNQPYYPNTTVNTPLNPQPYYPQPRQPMYQQPAPMQQNTIVWVGSEQEAFNYPVSPNSAVAMWDSNSPCAYLKQADASGKPSMKIYDLVERAAQPKSETRFVTMDEFQNLVNIVNTIIQPVMPKEEVSNG